MLRFSRVREWLTLSPVMDHQGRSEEQTPSPPVRSAMALYYFDFDDNGTIFPDDEGTECPDLGAVKYEAIKALAEMTKDALPDGDHHKLAIVVRDEGGDLAFRASIVFNIEEERDSSSSRSSPTATPNPCACVWSCDRHPVL